MALNSSDMNFAGFFSGAYIRGILIECRKTKTIVISLSNHNRRKQHNGPIRTQVTAPSAGKRVRPGHDWFEFCFPLVEKMVRVLLTNHRAKQSKTEAKAKKPVDTIGYRSISHELCESEVDMDFVLSLTDYFALALSSTIYTFIFLNRL